MKFLPSVTTSTTSSTVPVEVGPFTQSGRDMGEYFTADSGGNGNALLVNLPAFPVLTEYVDGVKSVLASGCPGCKTTDFDGTFAQLTGGQFVPAIITALRKDPSINYVIVSADLLIPTLPFGSSRQPAFPTSRSSAASLSTAMLPASRVVASTPQRRSTTSWLDGRWSMRLHERRMECPSPQPTAMFQISC